MGTLLVRFVKVRVFGSGGCFCEEVSIGDDIQTCMGSYYGYFAYVIYGFGFWIGVCFLLIVCRVVAN